MILNFVLVWLKVFAACANSLIQKRIHRGGAEDAEGNV